MIETIRQGLKEDGYTVSISKLCQWFGIPRRTVYYKPTKAAPKIKPELAEPIKTMIEESPSFGGRTMASFLRVAATRHWYAVTACAKSSSRRTAHSRTAWWNGSSEHLKSSVPIGTASKPCSMPAA